MKRQSFSSVVLALILTSFAVAEPWKPAAGPLMTRWAKDVSPENVLPEYPRPQMARTEWLNLNGLWQLQKQDDHTKVEFGKELPLRILVPFPVESALSGVMQRGERFLYRRTFQLPEKWRGRRILLHFGAVDWEATVFVNGKRQGAHRGGYDAFSYDITDALKPSGEQELIVKVFDPTEGGSQPRGKQTNKPQGIYYTPATGIWQTVWLEPMAEVHLERLTIVPDVDNSCLRLRDNFLRGLPCRVRAVAYDGKTEVARDEQMLGNEIKLDIPKDQLKLWSPENPFLYDLLVTIEQDGKKIDEVRSYFGMRKIDLGKDERGITRMRLNGKAYFQVGPLDQGFWPDGIYTAPTDEALRFDIEKTKELGFNMIRKHVKVEPARWYYWCDKLGVVVWQDMPSGYNIKPEAAPQFETELKRMIEGRFNHPSIAAWVVFNEGWGQHDTERYVADVKKWDPSRLVDNASGWTDKQVGDLNDIHDYPGPACPPPDAKRAVVLGEFGGLGLPIEGHTWTKENWGYRAMKDRDELTARYCNLLRKAYELEKTRGLSAVVYTQTTDVETECNGLLTYDREVLKVDLKKVAAANRGNGPKIKTILPTAQEKPQNWRYTFEKPADDWLQPAFDDSAWKTGPGGFGTEKTPGAVVGTVWNAPDIWLRREIELTDFKRENLLLVMHHDEDAEVYINGILAAKVSKFTQDYEDCSLETAARAAIVPGKNTIAVHCKQTTGGQYIDLGLLELLFE
ncbi:MAG: glycoside hydrolase family 2 [Pirellulales bacterium]|nr:glycoside hydrolase family 2 [Pirellulales bacterium]